jgi:hypothetical protein
MPDAIKKTSPRICKQGPDLDTYLLQLLRQQGHALSHTYVCISVCVCMYVCMYVCLYELVCMY